MSPAAGLLTVAVHRSGNSSFVAAQTVRIGILFSASGPYNAASRSMLNGALLAVGQINDAPAAAVRLEPVIADPGGDLARYPALCADLLGQGVRHVVGCYTSSSRKEVIPLFEKHDALLWYPSHYEGFESAANVIYTGAVPNQHLMPLVDHMMRHQGKRVFCIGSNYIWAWENNRILRENVLLRGGSVLAERYFAVGETDFEQVIGAIVEARPDFVFSTLIGTSAYRFLRRFRTVCAGSGIDQAQAMPVASCSLSEPELEEIGPEAVEGQLSSSVYFSSVATARNAAFVAEYDARFPAGPAVGADAEASYVAVILLARALAAAGGTAIEAVKQAVAHQRIEAPQGEVWIDPETLHAWLTPRIGRSNREARFDIVTGASRPIRPDPYLVWHSARFDAASAAPTLRVAS